MEKIFCPRSDARGGLSQNDPTRWNLSRVGVVIEFVVVVVRGGIRGHFRLSLSGLFALEFGQGLSNGSRFSSIGDFLPNGRQIGEEKTGRAKAKERRRRRREPRSAAADPLFVRGDAGIVVEFHEERRRKQFFHVHRLGQGILPVVVVVVVAQSSRRRLSHFSFVVVVVAFRQRRLPPVDQRTGRTRRVDSRLFQISSVSSRLCRHGPGSCVVFQNRTHLQSNFSRID